MGKRKWVRIGGERNGVGRGWERRKKGRGGRGGEERGDKITCSFNWGGERKGIEEGMRIKERERKAREGGVEEKGKVLPGHLINLYLFVLPMSFVSRSCPFSFLFIY